MKKTAAVLLMILFIFSAMPVSVMTYAGEASLPGTYADESALYVHAVSGSSDTEAWLKWQSVHDEDYVEADPGYKYFFLPSSVNSASADVYNGFDETVTLNGTDIPSKTTCSVSFDPGVSYSVNAGDQEYTVEFMNSNAEGAIFINNPDADGEGTDLLDYLNEDKSLSSAATGAIVTPNGKIDNTAIKKIKGRGNTSWDKPKKGYNVTYTSKVSIAGMTKNKKYSFLPNYQDDSLSRNRFLYDLSDAVGMPYASDSRYVDFYSNGVYWGSYLAAEKVEAGSLVTDVDDTAYLDSEGNVNEDFPFIAEVDASAGDDDYWVEASGLKITIKAPEVDEGMPGYDEVKAYVREKFTAFYNATISSDGLSKVADIDSVAKLYLINELGKNWDSGVSSVFFTYKQDENGEYKFYGSPVWDYDNTLGNCVGIEGELRTIGVSDYEEYTGWWCQHKGKTSKTQKRSSNIMARISRNSEVQNAVPQIWFEDFMPALEHFSGEKYSKIIDSELMTKDEYYDVLSKSAEMNYKSGWLINTGKWIADHTSMAKASYDPETKKMVTEESATSYDQSSFDDMYDYASDWMLSRAAWLSEQYAPNYTPSYILGDVDGDGEMSVLDATLLQRYLSGLASEDELNMLAADVNGDEDISITDVSNIKRTLANN